MFPKTVHWLSERLRYLFRWPINLVRDFPIRFRRLLATGAGALRGMIFLLPEVVDALRYREPGRWLRYKAGRATFWFHQLLAQLFDLVGGPELSQFLLHFFTYTTPLTDDELAMMSEVTGAAGMRYGETRVAQGGILDIIFKLNGNLAFATWHTINIPKDGKHTRDNPPLVAHELTHVYQYEQVGSRYLGEAIYMLATTKRDCYDYGGTAGLENACARGSDYGAFNREQQAAIVQDYCARRLAGADVAAYEPFIADLQAGRL